MFLSKRKKGAVPSAIDAESLSFVCCECGREVPWELGRSDVVILHTMECLGAKSATEFGANENIMFFTMSAERSYRPAAKIATRSFYSKTSRSGMHKSAESAHEEKPEA